MGVFHAAFGFFLTWWGAYLLAALDATMVFFLPFGIDAVVIYLAARHDMFFWLYPLLATAGSVTGAASLLDRSKAGRDRTRALRSEPPAHAVPQPRPEKGRVAMAFAALLPPPFPLTPFVLTCGALEVDRWMFFATFAAMRLIRFGGEATLARIYGRGVLRVIESTPFQNLIVGFIVVAMVGT